MEVLAWWPLSMAPGYLSAHPNSYERPKDNDCSKTVRIVDVAKKCVQGDRVSRVQLMHNGDPNELLEETMRWRNNFDNCRALLFSPSM
jgi:hypothetical protein